MRLLLLLLLMLVVTISMSLFPDIAGQAMRLEAFGWKFETQQGVFVVALLVLLFVSWLLLRLFSALVAGPGHIWQTLRMGGRERREAKLKEGIADYINEQPEQGLRKVLKGKGVVPDWQLDLFRVLGNRDSEALALQDDEDAIQVALKARVGTDPARKPQLDLRQRQLLIQAWLQAYPDSFLAQNREAELAVEAGDWELAAVLLERIWKRGLRPAAAVKPLLATAWLHIAENAGKQAGEYYRKAHRLMPHQSDVVLAVGRHKLAGEGNLAVWRLWVDHLSLHDDMDVADAAFDYMQEEALPAYRMLEKASALTPALSWLKARLAHKAGLDGLAVEIMEGLLEKHPKSEFWQTQAQWYVEQGKLEQAVQAYQQASLIS